MMLTRNQQGLVPFHTLGLAQSQGKKLFLTGCRRPCAMTQRLFSLMLFSSRLARCINIFNDLTKGVDIFTQPCRNSSASFHTSEVMSTVDSLPAHVSISKIDGDIKSLTEAAAIKEAVEDHIKTNVVDAGQPAPESVRAV